jgi:hypothetical protein
MIWEALIQEETVEHAADLRSHWRRATLLRLAQPVSC